MVWALQGAGREFSLAVETIIQRDKRKRDALIKATVAELAQNIQLLDEHLKNASSSEVGFLSTAVSLALLNNIEGFDGENSELLEELAGVVALSQAYNSYHERWASTPRGIREQFIELGPKIVELRKRLSQLATGKVPPKAI